jgi:hypothetical protein
VKIVRALTEQLKCRFFSRQFYFAMEGREVYPDSLSAVKTRREALTEQLKKPLFDSTHSGFLVLQSCRLNVLQSKS